MKYFQRAAVLTAAAVALVGCKQRDQQANNNEGQGGPSAKSEQESIRESAKQAKEQISEQAKAQKQQVEAEAKAAQARIDAEKAKLKAQTNDAEQAVRQTTEKMREAAGSASSKVQTQTGNASSQNDSASKNTGTPAVNSGGKESSSASDQSLTERVRQALGLNDPNIAAGRKVQVSVNNGTVTLSGTVASEEAKTIVEKQAKQVPGVTQVENQLQTAPQ